MVACFCAPGVAVPREGNGDARVALRQMEFRFATQVDTTAAWSVARHGWNGESHVS